MTERISGRISRGARDAGADELGAILDDLRDRVRDLEQTDQGGQRSIDDAGLDIYDDDDNLRGRIGRQRDGGFGAKTFGKKPATPTEPDVLPAPGGCVVEWDGSFEDAQPDEVQRIAVHVGTSADFQIVTGDEDDDSDEDCTERTAIVSPRGGSAFLSVDPGEGKVWVRLTAVAEGGAESDPSDAVEVDVAAPEAAFHQDTFTLTEGGAEDLRLTYQPLDNSEHLYWNGLYQREDITWTRRRKTITLSSAGFPARIGDVVTVEYAYLLGEQPEEITDPRGTPRGAYIITEDIGYGADVQRCQWYVQYEEDVLELGAAPPYADRSAALDYVHGDLFTYSQVIRWYERGSDGSIILAHSSYTNVGVPYTGWRENLHDGNVPNTFGSWILYHTREGLEKHPHDGYGVLIYPNDGISSNDPQPGDCDPRNGIFWIGPQIEGKPRPWAKFGKKG